MMNPLGKYGNIVAAFIAVAVILFWLAAQAKFIGLVDSPSLDTVAQITIGVVFGTQVVQNGTQTKAVAALAKAEAANARLDAIAAPSGAAAQTPTPTGE